MPYCYRTTRNLPFLTDFSTKDRQLAETAFSQQEERRRKTDESRGQKADEIVEDFRRQLHDLLGANNLAVLREAMKRERIAFRDLWQPPVDLHREYRKENWARKERLNALLLELGTSAEQLRQLGSESNEKLRGILSAADGKVAPGYNLPKNLDKWTSLSPLHVFPLPWGTLAPADDPSDPHRWFLFRPPFFGFLFDFDHRASDNFRVDRQLFLDPSSGLVGNEITMDCGSADDHDYAEATAEAQIAFGFEAPTTGRVEVLIDAQSTIGTHDLSMVDEWYWSDAGTGQDNYLMMNVLHSNVPEPSLALMSHFYAEFDGDDSTHHRENLTRGQHYFAQLFSAGPVLGGEHVVITVGTRTFDISGVDDVEVHSRSNFQWFINSVEVRIAP
ncbi:hypothetical protein [Methylocaldum sp.]|uniref:hypothetical protein n=1 Tax=Methylocaldum sp. TaxID=1969727 RepID=UPI002D38F857|nr:hypothetical protein [Methylocaldum sp.]HYE37530.1 hypothetical protein [Methylocaldum sp.]